MKTAMVFATFFSVLGVAAQQPPRPQEGSPPSLADKTAEQVYKNIQVLQGTPADQLIVSMHLIKSALGEDCEYCHVSTTQDAYKDDKPPKLMARKMISMVQEINKNTFGGRQAVTCYTCHRGSPQPIAVPLLPAPFEATKEAPAPTLPTADQILAKYVQALGGEQAIRKISTRVITGTQDLPVGPTGQQVIPTQVELSSKAPNLTLNVYHEPTSTTANGFDGAVQWAQDMNGRVNTPLPVDQMRAKRSADFYEPLDLKQEYPRLVASGVQKVNDRDAYVVIGAPAGDKPERLYFDVQTGLLLRKTTALASPLGDYPAEVNYDDYRDTGSGVKIPFRISFFPANPHAELQTHSTLQVQRVEDNIPIDSGKFVKPESKPAPAPPPAPPAQ